MCTLPFIVPLWVMVLNDMASPAIWKSARLMRSPLVRFDDPGIEIEDGNGHVDLKVGLLLLVIGLHFEVFETDVVFIDTGGGGGLEAAEEMTLQIVIGQDKALGFVTDGKGNVLQPDVFLRPARNGRRSGFAVLASGESDAAAQEQKDKT